MAVDNKNDVLKKGDYNFIIRDMITMEKLVSNYSKICALSVVALKLRRSAVFTFILIFQLVEVNKSL